MVQSGCAVCYPKWMVPTCSLSPHYVHGLSVFPFCAYINYRLRKQQSSPNRSHFTRTVQTKMRVPGARLASIRRDASCRRYFGPRWSHHRKRLVPQTASHPDTRLGTTHISRKRTGYALRRHSPDRTTFPGYSSRRDAANYNLALQGRQMRPDSLKFLLSWTNHRPAKRKISKPLVYDQVSSLGSPFALYVPHTGAVAYDHLSLINTYLQFNVSTRRPALHSPYSKAMNTVTRVGLF